MSPIKSAAHSVHGNTSNAPRPQVDLFDFPAWLTMDIQVNNPMRKGDHILIFTHKDVTYTLFNVSKAGFDFPADAVPKRLSNIPYHFAEAETSEVKLGLYDRDQNGTFDLALIAEKAKGSEHCTKVNQAFINDHGTWRPTIDFQFQLPYQPRLLEGRGYEVFRRAIEVSGLEHSYPTHPYRHDAIDLISKPPFRELKKIQTYTLSMEGRCNGHRYTVYSFSTVSFVDLDNDTPPFASEPDKDERAKKRHANLDAEVSYGTSCSASPIAYDTDDLPGFNLVLISDTHLPLSVRWTREIMAFMQSTQFAYQLQPKQVPLPQPKWHGRMWYQPRTIHYDEKTSACMQYSFDHFLKQKGVPKEFRSGGPWDK